MQRSVRGLAHGDVALAELDDPALTRPDILEAGNVRLTISSFVEILARTTRRVIESPPRACATANLIGDQHAGRRSVADAPSVEAGCDKQTGAPF